jgi:hypothetical protein
MKQIIESVNKEFRPKTNFACSNCPFSDWNSGTVAFQNYDTIQASDYPGVFNQEDVEFLDCYCTKKHIFTFDSTKQIASDIEIKGRNPKPVIVYKHIEKCQSRLLAVNEVLSKEV